jgi:hypothetical protein
VLAIEDVASNTPVREQKLLVRGGERTLLATLDAGGDGVKECVIPAWHCRPCRRRWELGRAARSSPFEPAGIVVHTLSLTILSASLIRSRPDINSGNNASRSFASGLNAASASSSLYHASPSNLSAADASSA